MNSALLLSEPINFAVVQLPGRRFPGVVVQGDTLHSILAELKAVRSSAILVSGEDAEVGLDDPIATLEQASSFYEKVCRDNNIALPYMKSPGE
ncbi:MAG: hypothetical protein KBA31_18595 [Alphaproteobacteria bacterium]|nr:hypothetical protein [Alphaproteobacteria bacterium]